MKMFNCYVLLPLVVVIGVYYSKAEICTNTTTAKCCECPEDQCDSCPSGFYRLDPPYPSDTGCTLVSTTPSPTNSTDTANTTTASSGGNSTASTTTTMTRPFSQSTTLCLKCSNGCGNCTNNSTCINCNPGFGNMSGTCSPINTTKDNSMYYIIGGVCGGVGLIIIIIIVVVVVVCRKRKQSRLPRTRTFTERSEAIRQFPTGIESPVEEEEVRPTTVEHVYENIAPIPKGFSQKIHQGHDKVLRYTPDPTKSIKLMSSRDNELSEVDELPEAPAPPIPKPKPQQSKRPTKAKKSNPAPTRDDVYEPVESVEPVQNDTGAHPDGEDYENELVMKQMKSVRKMSHQMNSEDHQEDDYENDQVLKGLKVDTKPEVEQTPEVDTEQDYENEEALEKLRKQEMESKPQAEPEHALQDYENGEELERLRKQEVGSILRRPTKDPLVDEELYENL